MSLRLSKKYGLNPTLLVCPICGKDTGIALLGANNGKQAPMTTKDSNLCDECKALYVQIIEVESETNKVATGRSVYVPKEALNIECPEGKAITGTEEFTELFIK